MINNIHLIGAVIALAVFSAGAFFIYKLNRDNNELRLEVSKARMETKQCEQGQKLSQEIYDATQAKLDGLNKQLNDPKWLRNAAKCVPTSQCNVEGSGGELSGRNGLTVGYLRDFAGRCESVRIRLLGAQSYIRELAK